MLTYKTYADLAKDIHKNIGKIPKDIDLIVGIPRSGMLPAYMLGQILSLPVCSLNEFLSGIMGQATSMRVNLARDIKNVFILDDSIGGGAQKQQVKRQVAECGLDKKYDIKYGAVYYADDAAKEVIDIVLELAPWPRMFQWNYLNHPIACPLAAYDIDGLLCVDPTPDQNDDGDNYIEFLRTASPLHIPSYEIGALVTSRLEKYREQTEQWLRDNGVKYKRLYMLDVPTAETRRRLGLHAKFKAEIFRNLPLEYFYESEQKQAREISIDSGKPCFCTTTDELFVNGEVATKDAGNPARKVKLWRRLLASVIPNRKLRHQIRAV